MAEEKKNAVFQDDSVPATFPAESPLPTEVEYPEEGETVMRMMEATVEKYGDRAALHWESSGDDAKDGWASLTWSEYLDGVRNAGKALIKLGLKPGGAVSIQAFNSKEYFFANLGAVWAGGHAAGIYLTNNEEQSAYVAKHSESSVVFVESVAHLRNFQAQRKNLPSVNRVVLMNGDVPDDAGDWVMSWPDFVAVGEAEEDDELGRRAAAVRPEDLAALIYTSGTTGTPKAVMISHRNITFMSRSLLASIELGPDDRNISYLPLSHIAAQCLDMYGPMAVGFKVYFARADALKGSLKETMVAVRPTIFFGVPRVFEKFREAMLAIGRKNPAPLRWIAAWGKSVGLASSRAIQNNTAGPWFGGLADAIVGSKVRRALGLDQCKLFYTAAAPISVECVEYFASLGVRICSVFGQSENTGVGTISIPCSGGYKVGAVGRAAPGTECAIADDGEILLRGPHVMQGYLKNEEATRETIDKDGWLHTGDLGSLDQHGFLRITGRKKDIIITEAGENVAPQAIELAMVEIPVVNQFVAVGERRKFVSGLVTLDEAVLPDELKKCGSDATDAESAGKCDKFMKHLQKQIDEVNKASVISRAATVRKVTIIPHEFTTESGEMTATQKLKRNVVYKNYEAEIDAMYA